MRKERKQESFIQKPVYPGGIRAMRSFIKENLKYPKEALDSKIEGSVLVKYEVNYLGRVTKTNIASGLGYGCDEEAARIVQLFKFEIGKSPRRLKVKFNKSIRIHFKLPKNQPTQKPSKVQLNYTVTDSKPSKYSYTIRVN